jgi:NAD(P)-dependent dehydrogenase (short-subunit alcohol dehydrogenase family)
MATTKVALITASSAGLGAQIARVFAPDFRVVRLSTATLGGTG